ncbi:hypothetical protein RND81_03G099300 [Saponaria officinalis]|uniref:Glycosyltransferase n=1 Tax=Saponaria officinalis TaxID=3572 RepID=A0AAW1M527_SAPOF
MASKNLHIAMFPFMSKGHTIPQLHLAKLIHRHRPNATFTIFTTPSNEPFISTSLSSLPPVILTIFTLPFQGIKVDNKLNELEVVQLNVENTDQLPSMSFFHSFVFATESMKPLFESTIEEIQKGENPISFLIHDFFLFWTSNVTSKLNIPRFYFSGMNVYAHTMSRVVYAKNVFDGVESMDEAVQIPDFNGISLTMNDFDSSLNGPAANEIANDFAMKVGLACSTSYGAVVNSFAEIESQFLTYWNTNFQPKSWCVGPFCLAENQKIDELSRAKTPLWMEWLNERKEEGKQVLYVAFGTQAQITNEQLKEMTLGLEKSGVDFLWALRIKKAQEEVIEGFEERVKERGMVVRDWVEQRAILKHESVQGFLSHCGWNSIVESICGGVPILAWPMMAEQHLNARVVVEEMKVGLRVETCDRKVRGFVKWEGLSKMVNELMKGDVGKEVRKNAREYSLVAKKAVQGGSSWVSLEKLLNELEDGMN